MYNCSRYKVPGTGKWQNKNKIVGGGGWGEELGEVIVREITKDFPNLENIFIKWLLYIETKKIIFVQIDWTSCLILASVKTFSFQSHCVPVAGGKATTSGPSSHFCRPLLLPSLPSRLSFDPCWRTRVRRRRLSKCPVAGQRASGQRDGFRLGLHCRCLERRSPSWDHRLRPRSLSTWLALLSVATLVDQRKLTKEKESQEGFRIRADKYIISFRRDGVCICK